MGKILIIRGGAIGDFILTLPAIRLIRESLPDAELEILGYNPVISLAQAGGYAERTRSIEYGPLARFFIPGAQLDKDLRQYFASFSVVVSYLFDPDHFFRENLKRAGVETLIECSHRINERQPAAPAAEQLAKPLETLALFLEPGMAAPVLQLNHGPHQQAAERFLSDIPQERYLIGVHPGSGSPYKNWDLERWIELLKILRNELPDVQFIIVVGEAEEEKVASFLKSIQELNLPHKPAASLLLPDLGAVLSRCRVFVGHDSGISHLAAAVGTPCHLLFGPTSPEIWAPPHPHVQVIQHPSGLLSEITPSEVAAQVLQRFR